jgi:hypothetical protein
MHVEFLIDSIHTPGVEKNQHHKNIDGSLLCEPEAQLKPANPDLVQLLDKKNAESERTDEPYEQAKRDQS